VFRKIFLCVVSAFALVVYGSNTQVEDLKIQFTSRSDFFVLGRLFIMSDGISAPKRFFRSREADPVPEAGKAVLFYEAAVAVMPAEWQERVERVTLARRDAVIWRDSSSPLTAVTAEEARMIFAGDAGDFLLCTLKNDDPDGIKPSLWLMGEVPLCADRMEFTNGHRLELMVAGNPEALGLGIFRGEPAGESVEPVPVNGALPGDENYPLAGEYRLYFLKEERQEWLNIAEIFRQNLTSAPFEASYYVESGIFVPENVKEEDLEAGDE
jgi:hypothetical protein